MKKILLIDDEQDMIDVLKYSLKDSQYEVITATDGVEGFAKVSDEKPDLIVLDMMMPTLDGYALIKEIRRRENLKSIPIVVLTGKDQLEEIVREEGVKDFFTKPFELQDVVGRIKDLVEVN